MPLQIGITGGIGSGKTTACQIFETLGIPVYYADERAKWLIEHDPALVAGIRKLFGEAAYGPDGSYQRNYVAGIVFTQVDKLEALNRLVHPAVIRDGAEWHAAQNKVPYTIKEAALLIESGSHRQLDRLIVVTAPEPTRVKRVMQRDQMRAEEVRARMERQLPEAEKIKLADFVIHNDGKQSLIRQVLTIHHKIISENP